MSRFHTRDPAQLEKELEQQVPQRPAGTSVTLTVSSAGTTLSHRAIRPTSHLTFTPRTANARSEGIPAITAKVLGQVTLLHSNVATSDRSFDVLITNP